MSYIDNYKQANTLSEKILCIIAKLFNRHAVTPLGRVILLPKDYQKVAHD